MTNSIFRKVSILLLGLCCFSCFGKRSQSIDLANRIPPDSFFIFSLALEQLLEKSKVGESPTWKPVFQNWRLKHPFLQQIIDDLELDAFSLNGPIHFFIRLQGTPHPTPVWGAYTTISSVAKADSHISTLGEILGLRPKTENSLRLANKNLPYEIGRRGKVVYAIGMIPNPKNSRNADFELLIDQLFQNFFFKSKGTTYPNSLTMHLSSKADASMYFEGTGVSRFLEDFFLEDDFKQLLPYLDHWTHRPIGLYFNSRPGWLNLRISDYSKGEELLHGKSQTTPRQFSNSLLSEVPGDSPVLGKLSFGQDSFKRSLSKFFDSTLNFISGGNFDLSKPLPGFESSIPELLDGFSGEIVVGGGEFSIDRGLSSKITSQTLFDRFSSSFFIGIGTKNDFSVKQLLAGIRSSQALSALMRAKGLSLVQNEKSLWLTTPDYRKELKAGRPIYQVPEERLKRLESSAFTLDFNLGTFTRVIRENDGLIFEENKNLQILDTFSNLKIASQPSGLDLQIELRNSKLQGVEALVEILGQEFIDYKNEGLYQAIMQEDYNALVNSVRQGALINANDRFGHTPLHYCAYKGNVRFVDYLLKNGGDPNARGRHLSTPLHSAVWARNMEVFELLLEDGAKVDARTDEGETPGMTASLRGEKDMLEILFALSADPHAVDIHGTNMLDIAAAGGHADIVSFLTEMGVAQNHPLHVACGLGKIELVRKLLKEGHDVNKRDAFGATPLMIAVVSGKMETVNFLLDQKADPQISAKDGYTLMHAAAFSGQKEMVKLVLSLGLEVNPRYGPNGITPVDVAEDGKNSLPYLRSYGGRASWELPPQ